MNKLTVLLADDEPHITHVVARKLEMAGYAVVVARDGEEAFELACDHRPDLVITDLQMPYMSGLELCAKLKQEPSTMDIPAFLLTARGYVISEDELAKTNIKQLMSKPFSAREILSETQNILGVPQAQTDSENVPHQDAA